MRIAPVAPLLLLLAATSYAASHYNCDQDQKGSTVADGTTSVTKLSVRVHDGTNYVDLTTLDYPCNSKNTMPGSPRHVGTLLKACTRDATPSVQLLTLDHGRVVLRNVPLDARATAYVYCRMNSSPH